MELCIILRISIHSSKNKVLNIKIFLDVLLKDNTFDELIKKLWNSYKVNRARIGE